MVLLDPMTDSNIIVVSNDTMTTLTRTKMLVDRTAGVYDCVAGNLLGESQNRIYVFVPCK